METAIERAVSRVIHDMRENLGEELTIDYLAQKAMFSKFHFTRAFRGITGVSPGRFLSALRLQEAKRLLVDTDMSVADISNTVGYSSVGTFSSRFKTCVGLAPSTYRKLGGFVHEMPTGVRSAAPAERQQATIRGEVMAAPDITTGYVFIGLFPDCIPQGQPACCAVLERPGPYVLERVPRGTWHVLVHSVPHGTEGSSLPDGATASVGASGPLTVGADPLPATDIRLRPMEALDPPVLLALLDMRRSALDAVAGG